MRYVTFLLVLFAAIVLFANPAVSDGEGKGKGKDGKGPKCGKRGGKMGRAMKRFKMLDKDGDGVITRDEFLRGDEVFDKIDADRDGKITPEEIKKAFEKMRRRARD